MQASPVEVRPDIAVAETRDHYDQLVGWRALVNTVERGAPVRAMSRLVIIEIAELVCG
jgi:hypothetical protein